jgi:hypothetical protein
LQLLISIFFALGGAWMAGIVGTNEGPVDNKKVLWFASLFGTSPESVEKAVGWILILLFGAFSIANGKRLFVQSNRLEINSQGIKLANFSRPLIAWHDIVSYQFFEFKSQKIIGLKLTSDGKKKQEGYLLSENSEMGEVIIANSGTDTNTEDIIKIIDHYLSTISSKHRPNGCADQPMP